MKLNHGKTTLIPLDRFINSDGDPFGRATRYVASLAPLWNTARVRRHANYLGVLVGPTAVEHMWKAPLDKWQRRAHQLAACGVAQDATLREYRGRALSCLSYLSQFIGPPPSILRIEQQSFATMTRFPFCACPRAMFHQGHRHRLVRVPPVEEYCRAASIRAAARHKSLPLGSR